MNKDLLFISKLNMYVSFLVLILMIINLFTINSTWLKGFFIGIDLYIIITSLACLILQNRENKRLKELIEKYEKNRRY